MTSIPNHGTLGTNCNPCSKEVFLFPASFAQQRLWFLHQLAPKNPLYNVSAGIRLSGNLNLSALTQTFNEIVRRHESLRTTFALIEEELTQLVTPDLNLSVPIVALQSVPVHQQEIAAKQLAIQEAQRPFDLTQDVLLRVRLLKLKEAEFILLLVLHHIITDAWSMGVLIREIGEIYAALSAGKLSLLPELPIQYADFAHWQREYLQGEILETQLSYWRQQLKDLPVLELPGDRPRPPVLTHRGATLGLQLSPALTKALEALSQREGVSLFMTLLAAFQTLLYRYTGQTDIVVGSPIANRNRSELEGIIGFFVNSLVLRTDLSGNPTFRELLNRVREVALGAYAHQDLPFEELVQALRPPRDLSRQPLFEIAIALQNTPIDALALPELQLSRFDFDTGIARLDLEFHLWQSQEKLQGQITYRTDLFEQATIARMLEHFQVLLAGIVSQPEQRIAELPLISAAEQHQLLTEWNQTQPIPAGERYLKGNSPCIHHLFEQQAQQTPNAIAVVFEDRQLSYRELNQRSNQLAHYLQQLGVCQEVLVGIGVERSIEMIVALLGILKAGGAYVPLDPTYPSARLDFILADTQVSIVVTQEQWRDRFAQAKLHVCLDRDGKAIAEQNQHNPTTHVTAANLAYVIYTSGSTGQPKGVLIEHHSLYSLAQAQQQIFKLQSQDRILQFASLSFDASIFEIVMALRIGATLYLVRQESLVGAVLIKLLREQGITLVTLPPALLRVLPIEELPHLTTMISAGEACSSEIVARWLRSDRRFYNAYGTTEAAVWSTIAELRDSNTKPLMGRAIPTTQLYVLDAQLQPVPIGMPGELYIGGEGLARGYLNRPELTAQRFIPNPFSPSRKDPHPHDSTRLYKTGDRVRYHPDGNLEFLERLDEQVKIRGYRIELSEVETSLSQHPAIRETAVTAQENSGYTRLVAYFSLNPQQTLNCHELRHFLQQTLPNYLIPSVFVQLDFLPLTPNGKIDRQALGNLYPAHRRIQAIIAPRTSIENKLADIWRQLLNLEQIGVDEGFFELGGDSLLAMQLMERVQQHFHKTLPLSTLFSAPTIAQLATLLEQPNSNPANAKATALPWSPLVPLTTGSKRPFFCIHPIFGVVLPYLELARQLETDQPFYGLQPFGLTDKQPPYTRIEDMAAQYIKAIQVVQPQGPYLLGGWSFGGVVAFEIAQQLQQAGQAVALLALLDTFAPVKHSQTSLFTGLKFLLTTVVNSILPFLGDYTSLLSSRFQEDFSQSKAKMPPVIASWVSRLQWAALTNLMPEESKLRMLDELTFLPMLRVFYANSQAVYRYAPKVYPGKITLYRTAQSFEIGQDSTLGWNQLTQRGVEVYPIPGNHLTMLRKPHVQVLAKQLQSCIEAAEAHVFS